MSPSMAEMCSFGCCIRTTAPGGGQSVQFFPWGILEACGNGGTKLDASLHDLGTKTTVLTGATIRCGLRDRPCNGAIHLISAPSKAVREVQLYLDLPEILQQGHSISGVHLISKADQLDGQKRDNLLCCATFTYVTSRIVSLKGGTDRLHT